MKQNLKNYIIIIGALAAIYIGKSWSIAKTSSRNEIKKAAKKIIPDKTGLNESIISELMAGCFYFHVNKKGLTEDVAALTLSNYIDGLDYNRVFFLQKDVDEIYNKATNFNKYYADGNWAFITNVYESFLARVDEQLTNALEYLEKPGLKLEKEREVFVDPKKRGFPKTEQEAKKFLEDSLQYQLAYLVSIGEPFTNAVDKIIKRRIRSTKRFHDLNYERRLGIFMNSFCNAVDPHSAYFSSDDVEDFEINMSLSLEGIGARLGYEEGLTKIISLTPGGPAEKSGLLKRNDKIIGVAQGDNEDFVDIIDMDLRDVVKLIRGKKGTVVKLKLVRKGGGKTERKVVSITRDKVELEDEAARLEFINVTHTNSSENVRKLKIAVIDLPSFYVDHDSKTFFSEPARSAVSDVRKLLKQCETSNVDGVILDLQRNGGGALEEAVDVVGLFLAKGNIVVATDSRNDVSILDDTDSDIVYKGPLIVTISRLTASGGEIVAAALQDYKRAIIVGSNHTYGKGTIQRVIPLSKDIGALKVTIGEYFLSSGRSPQNDGVSADIELPSELSALELGEKYQPGALVSRTIKPTLSQDRKIGTGPDVPNGWKKVKDSDIKLLANLSSNRVCNSKKFKEIEKNINKIYEDREREKITISYLLDQISTNSVDDLENGVDPSRRSITNDVVILEAVQILSDWIDPPKVSVPKSVVRCP